GGRVLGRALLHRHGLSPRLLHQLPPLPAGLPAHGARTLRPRRTNRSAMSRSRSASPYGPPLLIVCALRVERFGLRARLRKDAADRAAVIRTGMGARAAARAVTDVLRDPAHRGAAVLATGFCAGLDAGMRPGDVVVADGPEDGGPLAAALTAAGHTVHR